MLQQFIQRHLWPTAERAETVEAAPPAGSVRPADWLLGGSVATLAVVFVAGLLGLRASTAELQDQSRNNARDLAALKSDTLERIEGISGSLAKTNQTLTDLLALRTVGAAPKGRAASDAAADGGTGESGDAKPAARPVPSHLAAAPGKPAVRPVAKPPVKTVAKAEPVRLSTLTVRRRPERERATRRPEPTPRPVAAARPAARPSAQARREAILRELRERRLPRRG